MRQPNSSYPAVRRVSSSDLVVDFYGEVYCFICQPMLEKTAVANNWFDPQQTQ